MMRQPTFGIVVGMPPRKGKPDTLITYQSAKNRSQIVAIKPADGGSRLALFDAVELFMEGDTFHERNRVFERGKAKEFAEKFVAVFNAGAQIL
jgi:hypothetical protein